MKKDPQKPIVILGMHRSGTSVLAGCFNIMSAALSSFEANNKFKDCATGSECKRIALQHDFLLRDLGCRWDMIGSLPSNWHKSNAAVQAREKIASIVEALPQNKFAVFADPRMCRLMPLWEDIFQQNEMDPRFVLIVRHPYEVAKSLEKHCGLDLLKGHLLWLVHNREALTACRQHRHVVLTFDALLADPVSAVKKTIKKLGVEYSENSGLIYQRFMDFVRPELKNHNGKPQNNATGERFDHYDWLYEQLRIHQAMKQPVFNADVGSFEFPPEAPAINAFPKIIRKDLSLEEPEIANSVEVFDNLLGIISSYEQAELSRIVQRERLFLASDQNEGILYAQVYFPDNENGAYHEANSKKRLLAPGEWQQITIAVPNPERLRKHRLRLDPLNTNAFIKISAMNFVEVETGKTAWDVPGTSGFESLAIEGDAIVFENKEAFKICTLGKNAHILLPAIKNLPDRPIRLEIWIKASRDLSEMASIFDRQQGQLNEQAVKIDELQMAKSQAENSWKNETKRLNEVILENKRFISELQCRKEALENQLTELNDQLQAEKNSGQQSVRQFEAALSDIRNKLQKSESNVGDLSQKLQEKRTKNQALENHNAALRQQNDQMLEEITIHKQSVSDFSGELTRKDDLILEYFNELADTECKHQEELTRLSRKLDLQEKNNRQQVKDFEKQIAGKDRLISEYTTELSKAETLNANVSVAFARLTELLGVDEGLAFSDSRMFKKTAKNIYRKTPIEELQNLFRLFFASQELEETAAAAKKDLSILKLWIKRLRLDLKALMRSRRWTMGSKIITLASLGFKRPGKNTAINRLSQIIDEIDSQPIEKRDINWMINQFRAINKDFNALISSRRWRTGHRIICLARILILKKNPPLATERIKKILILFELWQRHHDYHDNGCSISPASKQGGKKNIQRSDS